MKRMGRILTEGMRKGHGRKKQIKIFIPELKESRSCLYIGASPDRFEIVDLLLRWGYHEIDVLEIWAKNVNELREMNKEYRIFRDIILGDVRKIELYIEDIYDVVMWWHGPEHIPKEDLNDTIRDLEMFAKKYVVIGCPWGEYPQGSVKGNKHEIHLASLDKKDFDDLGYKVKTLRKKGKRGSNILAWKRMK